MFEVKAKHVLTITCPGCRDSGEYDVVCSFDGAGLVQWQEEFEIRHAPCVEKLAQAKDKAEADSKPRAVAA